MELVYRRPPQVGERRIANVTESALDAAENERNHKKQGRSDSGDAVGANKAMGRRPRKHEHLEGREALVWPQKSSHSYSQTHFRKKRQPSQIIHGLVPVSGPFY